MATALDGILHEALAPLGAVAIRRMFGGAGVFIDGLMIGLVADDVLYLKADARSQGRFEAEGLGPFRYQKRTGEAVVMSYWQAPERLLDEPEEMTAWGREALAAARRVKQTGKKPTAKKPGKRPAKSPAPRRQG